MDNHFDKLRLMYLTAPIHNFYTDIDIRIDDKKSVITLPINEKYFHAGMSLHGSVYFKLLDDAAYFACQSVVNDFFLLTAQFTIDLKRPVTGGLLTATGFLKEINDSDYIGSSVLINEQGKICAEGKGIFKKSKTGLNDLPGYANS